MDNSLEKRVRRLEQLHIWGGAVLGVLLLAYVLKKNNKI